MSALTDYKMITCFCNNFSLFGGKINQGEVEKKKKKYNVYLPVMRLKSKKKVLEFILATFCCFMLLCDKLQDLMKYTQIHSTACKYNKYGLGFKKVLYWYFYHLDGKPATSSYVLLL